MKEFRLNSKKQKKQKKKMRKGKENFKKCNHQLQKTKKATKLQKEKLYELD